MNLEQIKKATEEGKIVYVSNCTSKVIKDEKEQWLIVSESGLSIGLTWRDGVTLNSDEEDFYIAPIIEIIDPDESNPTLNYQIEVDGQMIEIEGYLSWNPHAKNYYFELGAFQPEVSSNDYYNQHSERINDEIVSYYLKNTKNGEII